MRKKNYKGKCQKRALAKCKDICKTYDDISYAYADTLQADGSIREIRCNVPLVNLPEGEYTSDFVCTKTDGDVMVRECVFRKHLTKPMTIQVLDMSREYWFRQGIADWGIVVDAEE